VDTRLRKLREGEADAVVLAGAGLRRLGLESAITEWLSPDVCVPAAGQGILCLETREADAATRGLLPPLDCPASRACAEAERRVVAMLGGGCNLPLGVLAEVTGAEITLTAALAELDGSRVLRAAASGPATDPAALAAEAVAQLREHGSEGVLARNAN
jgi:hydroxymethylbilane synthase